MQRPFEQLVALVFENPQDAALVEELSQRLENNPEECRAYLKHSQLQADLYYLISAESAESKALDVLGANELGPPATTEESPRSGPYYLQKRKGTRFLGFLALAASLAFVSGWYLSPSSQYAQVGLRQPTIVGTVVSIRGDRKYVAGQSLRAGRRLQLDEGTAKVNLPIGAELVLQAPCEVLLESPGRLVLERGQLTARMADWASDLQVETVSLTASSLGLQFAVEVDGEGNTEVHALEGEVRIHPIAQADHIRNSFLLTEGEAIRVGTTAAPPARLEAQGSRFVTDHGDFHPYRPIDIYNSGRGLAVGDEDPHWKITQGAIGEGFQGEQFAVVCEPDDRYLPNQPLLSQWVSVSKNVRPGCLPNSAYTFQTEFDLTGYDIATVVVLADMLADNGVRAVRINGQPVDLVPWKDNQYLQEFHRYRRAEIVSGFIPGKNVIEIDVWNGVYHFGSDDRNAKPSPNPMALRVEWQAFGVPSRGAPTPQDTI